MSRGARADIVRNLSSLLAGGAFAGPAPGWAWENFFQELRQELGHEEWATVTRAMREGQRLACPDDWNPAETLNAFVGWLTTLDDPVIFGREHPAPVGAELIRQFAERHGLSKPRPGWETVIRSDQ